MDPDLIFYIRFNLQLYAICDPEVAHTESLWYSRAILRHLMRNNVTTAVPTIVSLLDEKSVRFQKRTASREFIMAKQVKFGTRFAP